MDFSTVLCNQAVPVHVTLRRNTKRMSLRFVDGHVRISAPLRQSLKSIERFVSDHRAWLEERFEATPPPLTLENGLVLPILGQERTLHLDKLTRGPRVELTPTELICRSSTPELSIPRFLRTTAHPHIEEKARAYAAQLGLKFETLQLKDTRSRWGSCSHKGRLNIHWKLIFAPSDVMDYVIAHEVCHLKEFNHSSAFWKLVSSLCPGYVAHRRWLKKNGPEIQNWLR
jgi:predicted metal-dependent hydrolase